MLNVKYRILKEGVPDRLLNGCVDLEIDNIAMADMKAKSKIINNLEFVGFSLSESDIECIQITDPTKMKAYMQSKMRDVLVA